VRREGAVASPRFTDISLFATVLIAMVSGCERERVSENQFLAFGTLVEVTLYDVEPELAEKAFDAARKDFAHMHATWHAWQPSPLTRTNALIAAGKPFIVAPEILPLIERTKPLSNRARGLFNPAIGALIELWGFHSDVYIGRRPPPDAKIKALVEKDPSMDDLVFDGKRLSPTNQAVQLDFGGFAKGYGVGRVVEHLQAMGVEDMIVNAGGDLRATGAHGDRPWRIGIRQPRAQGILASLAIDEDESVFTSGDYERYFLFKGSRYHHILDPHTGYPARGAMSVTVVHGDPGTADAAATALMVAGADRWRSVARSMGIRNVLLIDHHGRAHMTPTMAKRITFEVDPLPRTLVTNLDDAR
jgi:FAD:protein FMN transferase